MKFVEVASGLGFVEGPVWNAADSTVSLVSISRGSVFTLDCDGNVLREFATGGGPNGMVLGHNGLLVAQNGGIFGASGAATPAVQAIRPDGVDYAFKGKFTAPNDLAFGPNGLLYVTDPQSEQAILEPVPGKVYACDLATGEHCEVITDRLCPNGLAFTLDGSLLLAQTQARIIERFSFESGHPKSDGVFCSLKNGRPDGIAIDQSGRVWVCTPGTGGIEVFGPEGGFEFRVEIGTDSMTTNLCFGGADGRDLFVTAAGWGKLLRARCDVAGLALLPGTEVSI